MKPKSLLVPGIAGLLLSGCQLESGPVAQTLAYVGTQASGPGEGVVAIRLDAANGSLKSLGVMAQVDKPTWVLADPAHRRMFAVSEVGNDGKSDGAVFAFSYDQQTGMLRANGQGASGGGGPTHLALSAAGETLFVANYGTGQVAAISVGNDGRLATAPTSIAAHSGTGPNRRQKGPHAHGVTLDPSGRYLLSPDLGADRVFVYRVQPGPRQLEPADAPFVQLPAGSGPRHIVFAPDGRLAFLMAEITGMIFSYGWEPGKGKLTELSRKPLDNAGYSGPPSGSELAVSRDGRFLYAGNRAADRIQVYAIARSGALALVQSIDCGGKVPWGFALSGSGKWLVVANQGSGNLASFAVNRSSGRLKATGNRLELGKPTSVSFTDR